MFSRHALFLALLLPFSCAIVLGAPPAQISSIANSIRPPEKRNVLDRFSEDVVKAHPGPWGNLEWTTMYLEAPDYLLDTVPKASATHWVFPDASKAKLHELFARAQLSPKIEERLLATAAPGENGALILSPSNEELESLSPDVRSVIYAELGKSSLNEYHRDPVIVTGELDDWLTDMRLRPQLLDEIRKTIYRSGRILAFSDIPLLLSQGRSEAEVKEICRMITRTRVLMGSLKIPPGSNTKQLCEYWTGGRAASDILPLLETSAERTGGASLDITHLLPPFARRRIYTFPANDLLIRGRMPDCHWTSLNFFNNVTQDYYLDMRLAANRLVGTYTPVESPYHFGDLLCLLNTEGEGIHSCIYVADDVVFTKNGENKLRPWILMPLQEVQDYYSRDAAVLKGFRRKPPGIE